MRTPKAQADGPADARIVRAEEVAAWRDGYDFLKAARAEAETTVADARALYEAERKRGYEEGRRAGAEEASRLMTEAAAGTDAFLDSIEREFAELVIDTVERLIGTLDQREVAARAARLALQNFRTSKRITLRVAPAAVDDLRQRLADVTGQADDTESLTIVIEADATLPPDGCLLACEAGFVDASIEVQLAALRAGLAAVYGPARRMGPWSDR